MNKYHIVKNIRFQDSHISLNVDGNDYSIDLNEQSKKLAQSSHEIKENYILSPSGYGIHWPDIDEDLSIDGLIGIKHSINHKVTV